ncbi:leucine-rich repeat domain-containing protein [Zooshikella marina]|uniref:leucine-rich repeat domain-containing protein n=1 Tax=Zooshikella ganghwensis TaxID=202772 RepID=UPI001BB0C10C|nr:leucine-rich repeat domain-containing protein [Zooshikella ganghwensis]MBU2704504.1 leucine-rich repeat domain-containing protein [Zooshikella ganghwensis]
MMNYRVLITILFLCSLNVQAFDIEIKADKVNSEHLQAIKDAIMIDENNNDRLYAKYKVISQNDMNPTVVFDRNSRAPELKDFFCRNCFIVNSEGDIVSGSISDAISVDIKYFRSITTIKHLLLLGVKVINFNKINMIENLKYITSERNYISSDINISNPNLEYITLVDNKISKITLNSLENLKYLDISNNSTVNLEGIKNSKKLEVIDISDNNIHDLSELSDIRSLRHISMLGNITPNLSFLEKLDKLEHLLVHLDKEWKDYKVFGSLVNLKGLYIILNSDLHRLNQLPKIESLKILALNNNFNPSGQGIRSLQGVEHFPNLEELILRNNKVTKIEGLEHLPKLTSLTLDKNPIRQWKGLEKASDTLETLSIEDVIETVRPSNQPTLKVSEKERVIRLLRDRGVTVIE